MNNALGTSGEDFVANFLVKNFNYKILDRNYSCGPFGEIDIVAKDNNELVFVEVKSRSNDNFMDITGAINYRKKHALKNAALFYVSNNNISDTSFRIDLATYNKFSEHVEYYEDVLTE